MPETIDPGEAPVGPRTNAGPESLIPIYVLRGLLSLYGARDQRSIAHAIASLVAPISGDALACAFVDDGSGALIPLVGHEEAASALAGLRLSSSEAGPVARVVRDGEVLISDSLKDIAGQEAPDLPAHRILVARLRWEDETLGVALFGDDGHADPELYLEIAKHISLALVRLRVLDKTLRFGGIDPTRWMFDREWLHQRLEEEVERARRYGRPLTLLRFVFEGLDELAEKAGRHQVEVFLRKVAAVVRGQIRSPDILAGYGDASIAVLLPETKHEAGLATQYRIASRVSKLRPARDGDEEPSPRLLLGAATCPADGESAQELLSAAEARLAEYRGENRLQDTA
jgi:diguanylate cyclase (GGDEF)-like protein